MKAKFYDKNREGKWYPSIELDLCEVFDEMLSSMDKSELAEFVNNWIGHERFLELATEYMTNAYSSHNCEVATTEARARLLEALTDNRAGVAAQRATSKLQDKWYYEGLFWQMYHGIGKFMRDYCDATEIQKWHRFFDQYKQENAAPEIGSKEWNEYRKQAHDSSLALIRNGIDAAAAPWQDYDPETSPDIEEGCWHLIDCGDSIDTSRWCNQRHWIDADTAIVKRYARVLI